MLAKWLGNYRAKLINEIPVSDYYDSSLYVYKY